MLIAELVETHRSYGRLPLAEYDAFVDLAVDEVAQVLGGAWDRATNAAWRRQAERLKAVIARAQADWDRILPQSKLG